MPPASRRGAGGSNARRREWEARCEQTAADFSAFIAGKSVALVGPAASLIGRRQGDLIDSHDVVVRLNLGCPVPAGQEVDLGARTNVLYHVLFNARLSAAAGQSHTVRQVRGWADAGVRFIVTRQDAHNARVERFRPILGDLLPLVVMSAEWKRTIKDATGTNPNTGTLAICHLLDAGASKVWVTGFDFYATGYHVGYGGFSAARAAQGTGGGNWGQRERVPHKQEGQMAFLADLARADDRLVFDEVAAERLGLIPPPPTVTALVPMKGHSERVPGKNIRDLCGKPLLFWTLDALHKARRVSRVVVDTDDDTIAELVAELHPQTTILRRPDHLLGGHITGNPLTEWEMTQVEGEHFLQTHVTNPLITPATIDAAVDKYFAALEVSHDSLFSVTEHHFRLFDAAGRPLNHNPAELIRSQDLDPIYEDNSCLYVFSRTSFTRNGGRVGRCPQMFPMSKVEAVDIDYEDDFTIAEALMARRLA